MSESTQPPTQPEELVEHIDDDELEAVPPADELLEEKYAKQMRQIYPQKIELPISTIKQMIKEQIQLNPDFQRRDRWDNKRRSRFIESIIMNVPIPPVFLGEDKYGHYVVLDGRQRLTALNEYLNNGFALEKLEVWKEFNGHRFAELEKKGLERTLTRRFVPAILLLKESTPEVKYDVFDRLNTGGMTANHMEIRNAVFQGPFNRNVHKLSEDTRFRALWGIPSDAAEREKNILYSTMSDVQLVLRFFALYAPEKMMGSFKWYLGHFMGERNTAYESDTALAERDKEVFLRAVIAIEKVFGAGQAFIPAAGKKKSAPLSDALMVGFAQLDIAKLAVGDEEKLRVGFANLIASDNEFSRAISSGTNGKGAIQVRVGKAKALVKEVVPHAVIP